MGNKAALLSPCLVQRLGVLAACAGWVTSSSGAILVNKTIMVDLSFPYPATVAAIGMCGTSIISSLVVRLLQQGQKGNTKDGASGKSCMTPSLYLTTIVPTGLCMALAMQLGNTAYLYLPVAFIQMLKSAAPVVTLLLACLFGLEQPSVRVSLCVSLIAVGMAVASRGQGSLSIPGLVAMAGALLCEGLRLVLMQRFVARQRMHPMETLAHLAPAAAGWTLAIAAVTEAPSYISQQQGQPLGAVWQHPHLLLASALAGVAVNSTAIVVIAGAGALTLKCLGLAKDVGLVLYGAVMLWEPVSSTQAVGYSLALAGFAMYNAIQLGILPQLLGRGGLHAPRPTFRCSECATLDAQTAAAAAAVAGRSAAGAADASADADGLTMRSTQPNVAVPAAPPAVTAAFVGAAPYHKQQQQVSSRRPGGRAQYQLQQSAVGLVHPTT